MTSKQYFSTLRSFLLGGALFMLGETIFHFSGIRTAGIDSIWPKDAVAFVHLFVILWASASFAFTLVLFYLSNHVEELKPLLKLLAVAAVVHAGVLFYLSLTPYPTLLPLPNLYVWMPFYVAWLRGEGIVVLSYAAYIGYGTWKKFL